MYRSWVLSVFFVLFLLVALCGLNGSCTKNLSVSPQNWTATPTITATSTPAPSNVSTFAGTTQGYSDGPVATAKLYAPYGVAVDTLGNVYVGDYGNNRIREISGGNVSTIAGSGGFGLINAPALVATFNAPANLAVDASGNIYIADNYNGAIRKLSGGVVSTLASGPPILDPYFVTVDGSGNVYVSNSDNEIIKISGGVASVFAGTGAAGAANGPGSSATFDTPAGLATDAAGNVYVADTLNNLIRMITPAGVVSTYAGTGVAGATNGPASSATFYTPDGVAMTSTGILYVSEYYSPIIRAISPGGIVTTVAGTGATGYVDGPGTSAEFNTVYQVAVDGAGNVYLADSGNNVIRKIVP